MTKKYVKTILTAVTFSLISTMAGFWIFEIDWPFLPFPLLAGICLTLTQTEKTSYKFLDKIIIGSLVFGFLSWLLIFSRMYLISNLIYHADFPFWPTYNFKEYLTFSLVFSFVSFLGSLAGIIIKGLYFIINDWRKK